MALRALVLGLKDVMTLYFGMCLMQLREGVRLLLRIGQAEEDLLLHLAESAHRYPRACLKQLQTTENPLLP